MHRAIRPWVTVVLLLSGSLLGQHAAAQATLLPELMHYLKEQGPIAKRGVLNGSGPKEQLLLYYCVDQNAPGGRNEGALNSKNFYCEIALFNRSKDGWAFANREALGHGTVLGFSGGIVTATSVTYAADDALCCPSKRRTVKFATTAGNLVAVR